MSLETLLEAAKYIEYRSEAKARGEVPKDYHSYATNSPADNGGSVFLLPSSYSSSNNDDNSPNYYDNDAKDRRRSGGAGTREVHNKLEKNRRAHLKKCFETLKKQIPNVDDKKTSNLGVLRSAFRYIQTLKRKEREYEFEMERLAREKVALQQRLTLLRRDLSQKLDLVEVNPIVLRDHEPDNDSNSNSTSTASECGPLSDIEDDKNSDEVSQESVAEIATELTGTGKDINNGSTVSVDIKPSGDANNKSKSLALLAKSAEAVSLSSIKTEPQSPKASPLKVALAQSAPVTIRAIQPHVNAQTSNSVANGGAAVGETTIVKVEPQASPNVRAIPQRAAVSAQLVPQSTVATNGNAAPAPPAAIKLLAPQTVRILAPVAATTVHKTLAMAASGVTTLTSTRVALAASGATSSATIPLTTLAMGKTVPTIKRVAALAPVQVASSIATVVPSSTIKGVLTTGHSHGSIAIGQLAVKSSSVNQQPILAATAINFHAAAPLVTSSPSASVPAATMARQLVTATVKPVTQVRSQVAQITQVMAPTTLVSSVGQVIPGGSNMNPIVAPMSVMSSMNRTAVAQVISPSQLGKVMAAPFIKTVPIYQQQLFPHLGAVSSQTLVNPIVMVTTPNVVPVTTAAQATLPSSR